MEEVKMKGFCFIITYLFFVSCSPTSNYLDMPSSTGMLQEPSISRDTSDIASKAFRSDIVLIAEVVNSTPKSLKLSDDERSQIKDLSQTLGGILYTLKIEQVVCAGNCSDFNKSLSLLGNELFLFVKRENLFKKQSFL
jgi:hypothetical protein